MSEILEAYAVVFPKELQAQWAALPEDDRDRLDRRLQLAAQDASTHPATWPAGPAGVHRGRHRARVGELWVLYRPNDRAQTVDVIGFGRVPA